MARRRYPLENIEEHYRERNVSLPNHARAGDRIGRRISGSGGRSIAVETQGGGKGGASAAKPKVPFTISKETTYITEPLGKDGYPDYIAAINLHYSKGVTPENNAAVLFWRAMGPGEIPTDRRAEYFKQLGIDPLPEKGDYFVTMAQFAQRLIDAEAATGKIADESLRTAFYEAHTKAAKRPWSKEDFPQIATWLEVNEKQLALFIEASKRPRRFDPLLPGKSFVLSAVVIASITPYREAVHALAAAMLRLNAGRVDDAWEDLLSCHRLARLVAEGPTLVDYLVGTASQIVAGDAEQGMLRQMQLSAPQAKKMRDDLDRLPAMSRIADKIDHCERFDYLDSVAHMARDGVHELNDVNWLEPVSPKKKAYWKSVTDAAADGPVDWDLILRMGNASCDRIVDSMRKSTRQNAKQCAAKWTCKSTKAWPRRRKF